MVFPSQLVRQFQKINAKELFHAGPRLKGETAYAHLHLLTVPEFLTMLVKAGTEMTIDGKVVTIIEGIPLYQIPHPVYVPQNRA